MDGIHRIIEALRVSGSNHVLATIIRVEGSAYLKEGTTMLFREDGTQIGILSGGCLEADLAHRAADVLDGGHNRMLIYDMRDEDDLSWGQGSGCNGLIYVLLEQVDQQRKKDLFTLQSYLDRREPILFIHKLSKDLQGLEYGYFPLNGQSFGSWQRDTPEILIERFLAKPYNQPASGVKQYSKNEPPTFVHYYYPRPRLIIIGAGSDAKPLVDIAKKVGFIVILADWREAYCNVEHFPDADQFITGFTDEMMRKLCLTQDDFIILMTHQFQRDQEILSFLEAKKIRYIGVLGSGSRMNRLMGDKERPASIHSPIGVPIGAEGPEEIAISILAEIIGTLRMTSKCSKDDEYSYSPPWRGNYYV